MTTDRDSCEQLTGLGPQPQVGMAEKSLCRSPAFADNEAQFTDALTEVASRPTISQFVGAQPGPVAAQVTRVAAASEPLVRTEAVTGPAPMSAAFPTRFAFFLICRRHLVRNPALTLVTEGFRNQAMSFRPVNSIFGRGSVVPGGIRHRPEDM